MNNEQSLDRPQFTLHLTHPYPAKSPTEGSEEQSRRDASRFTHHVSRLNPDTLISFLLFLAGLYAYTATLAPTVIEGDAALFQFTPYVLGVTYPTGFPLYILLGKLWVTIFPFGEIAWRMNLFSALCSATALPLIYNAARRFFSPLTSSKSKIDTVLAVLRQGNPKSAIKMAALLTVLTFATLPTFWRWSTEAKTYGLNILLFSGMLYTLAQALEATKNPPPSKRGVGGIGVKLRIMLSSKSPPGPPKGGEKAPNSHLWGVRGAISPLNLTPMGIGGSRFSRFPLVLPTLLLGLLISVHNTGVLLVPGYFVMIWLHFRQYLRSTKSIILHLILLVAPSLFYLDIPLRAEWLIARYDRLEAIERGLLADFYQSGLAGLIRYFSGAGFTEGVVANWGLVPEQFFTVYIPLLTDDLTGLGVMLGFIGGVALGLTRPRLFLPLFLVYAVPIPFVIVYGQGEQSAFLLPSFLIYCLFVGNTIIFATQLIAKLTTQYAIRSTPHASRLTPHASHFTPLLLLLILIPFLFLPQIQHNVTWLSIKWNRDIYNEWADALSHPIEPEAGMLAHWGDLTSFWYMQHAEGRRPDLRGVYPPTEETVIDWYSRGNNDLYIAGPLQGWAAGIQDRYQLIPWGRLVRIAPRQVDPQSLLPNLSQTVGVSFGDKLHLIGADYAPQAVAGLEYPITLAWQTLAELPPETTVSVRLSQDGVIVAQLDDRLRSGWFPSNRLPADQHLLSYALLPVPLGTLPGKYRLQLVAYTNVNAPWPLPDGPMVLDLGQVEIVPPPASDRPDLSQFKPLPAHSFNGEIELAGYDYSVRRVGQGKGFAVKLLWQAQTRPAGNYTLLVEALDTAGNLLRAITHQPVGARAPTASWQAGQFIRDQVDMVVPAGAPPGQDALQVQLSWLRPDGSKLTLRRWGLLPLGDSLALGRLDVTAKKERVFDLPQVQHTIDANLENKVRLIGYNTPLSKAAGPEAGFQLNRSACAAAAGAEDCKISVDFYWQGISEMELLYQVFFHVVDSQGQIIAQRDGVPGKGKQPTTGWLPGEVVLDPVELHLPANIAAGQYTIRVGMYLPPEGPRLLILDETGQTASDFVDVATLEITAK